MNVRISHRPIARADIIAVARHDAVVLTGRDGHDEEGGNADGVAWLRGQAAGTGEPLAREIARATLLLQAHCALAKHGRLADGLAALLNNKITPWVPETGSLGTSSDHGPQAHCALVLAGEGWVLGEHGCRVSTREAFASVHVAPLSLSLVEAQALLLGTQATLALLVLCLADLAHLTTMADVTAALTVEALLSTERPFHSSVHDVRPHPGQRASAANLYSLLRGSTLVRHSEVLQDAYSLRCAPQVAGAARDTLHFAQSVVDGQLTGEPAHGARLGLIADFLAVAAAELGTISERRIDRLLDPARSRGLPVLPGCSAVHRTAAELVSENRRIAAAPSSVDSIPTAAMRADHVSFAWAGARKLRRAVGNLAGALAAELLVAGAALRERGAELSSQAAQCAVTALNFDTLSQPATAALEHAREIICGPRLRTQIESVSGPLG